MSSVSTTNRIKYNDQNYSQIVSMNDDKAMDNVLSLFKVFIGKQNIAELLKENSSYSFKFNNESLEVLDFDNNFKGSELEKIIKDDDLRIITATDKNIPVTLKEKNNKEIVFEVESTKKDARKAFKITIDAVSITIDYDGKKYLADITEINKDKLSDSMQEKLEINKKKPILSFDINSSLYEELAPESVKDLKSSNLPLYMLTQYVDLLEANNISNESQTIEAKKINDKLNVYKYSFAPDKKEDYFAFVKDNDGTHLLFGKQIEKISNCRLYYSKNGNKKDYFLIVSTGKKENIKLDLATLGDEQGKTFLQNFNSNIQNIEKPTERIATKEEHWGFTAQQMDDRIPISYEISKSGISTTIKKKEIVEDKEKSENEENKTQPKTEENKEEDKEEDKEDKKHKFNTKFYGDMFTTLSFFSLIAAALIPGLGALMAGLAVAFIAGSAISYAVDSYEMSIARSVKKIKENDYTKFRNNDKLLQKAKENLIEAQASLQKVIENSSDNSFTKQFIDLYNKNGIVKENINLAQRYNFATGKDADLETLTNLEMYEAEPNKKKKEELKDKILENVDKEKKDEIGQKLFGQPSFFDIEQLNVQEDVYNDLQQIQNEENKEEKLKYQNDFVKRYFPSVSEEELEETREYLFDKSKGTEEFNLNLSNYINNEKMYKSAKERNIHLIEENKIDYLINLFSKREEKECTKMLSDYGETIARRFAYGKEFSKTQLKKFIHVLPQNLQKQSRNLLKQKSDKICKSIDALHKSIEFNVNENNKLDQAFNFLKYTINSDKIPFYEFNDVLKYLPEDISTKAKIALEEGKTLKEFLVKEINKNTKMNKYLCSILNLKKFKVNDDLTLQATFKNGTEKNVMLSEQNLNNLINKCKKENNSNSTRQSLVLANILGEDAIKREIKTVKNEFEKGKYSAETKDKELIKADIKYKEHEDYLKDFQSITNNITTKIKNILKEIKQTVFDESSLKTQLGDLNTELENIKSTKGIKKSIEKSISQLNNLKDNLNKKDIKKAFSKISKILTKINKKKNKQLARQNKKTIKKQNYVSDKSGKEAKATAKSISQTLEQEQQAQKASENLIKEIGVENNFVEELSKILQEEKE